MELLSIFVKNKIMVKLLKLEIKKIKNYPLFWVVFGIIIFLLVATLIVAARMKLKFNIFSQSSGFDIRNYFLFPHIWTTFTWIAGWFSHFWSILIIILVGNEFNYRMMRQQLVFGTERKNLLTSKILLIVVLPVLMILAIFILGLIFGLQYSQNPQINDIFDNIYFLINYYVQIIAYMSFAMLIVLLLRSTGLSIVLYLGYLIFEGIFRSIIKLKFEEIIYFLPIKAISSLTPRPSIQTAMTENLQKQINIVDVPMHFSEIITLLIALTYLFVFWGLSYFLMKKRDL